MGEKRRQYDGAFKLSNDDNEEVFHFETGPDDYAHSAKYIGNSTIFEKEGFASPYINADNIIGQNGCRVYGGPWINAYGFPVS